MGKLKVTSSDETAVFRGLGETGSTETTVIGREDLDGLLSRARRGLDVAGVVGRHAVEAVGMPGLGGELRLMEWRGRDGRPEGVKAPPSVLVKMSKEAIPEAGLLPGPFGSDPVTETAKAVDVVVAGSELTLLVGGVVSITLREVESEPVPGISFAYVPAYRWRSRTGA